LALAIDDLTENVFIITQNHEPLDQNINKNDLEDLIAKLKKLVERYPKIPLVKNLIPHLVSNVKNQILLQNPLIIKQR